jgi:hypothetical protein
MIESTSVPLPTWAASGGTASGALCGLTAITIAAAAAGLPFGLSLSPRRMSALTALPGCGSITTSCFGLIPRASQPSSMALPIFPAPSSTRGPENLASVLEAGFFIPQ